MQIKPYNYEILYFRDEPGYSQRMAMDANAFYLDEVQDQQCLAQTISSHGQSDGLNYSTANAVKNLSNPLNEVKLMSIPIPAETPDPMIDDPALPVPKPDEDPPPTMPPVIPTPQGDPPSEEPPAILGDELKHDQGRDLPA